MKNYIERGALMKRMEERLASLRKAYGNYDHYTDGFEEGCVAVEDADAADVVERKRGEWVDVVFDPVRKKMTATCTSCSRRGEIRAKSNYCGFAVPGSDFCPSCGSDMRSHQNILCDQTEEGEHDD